MNATHLQNAVQPLASIYSIYLGIYLQMKLTHARHDGLENMTW